MLVTYNDTGTIGAETSGIHTIVCRAGAGWHYRSAPRDFSQCLSTDLGSVDNPAGDHTQRFTGRNPGEAADPPAAVRWVTPARGREGLDELRHATATLVVAGSSGLTRLSSAYDCDTRS